MHANKAFGFGWRGSLTRKVLDAVHELTTEHTHELVYVPLPERSYRWCALIERSGLPWRRRTRVVLLATRRSEYIDLALPEPHAYAYSVGPCASVKEALASLLTTVEASRAGARLSAESPDVAHSVN